MVAHIPAWRVEEGNESSQVSEREFQLQKDTQHNIDTTTSHRRHTPFELPAHARLLDNEELTVNLNLIAIGRSRREAVDTEGLRGRGNIHHLKVARV